MVKWRDCMTSISEECFTMIMLLVRNGSGKRCSVVRGVTTVSTAARLWYAGPSIYNEARTARDAPAVNDQVRALFNLLCQLELARLMQVRSVTR